MLCSVAKVHRSMFTTAPGAAARAVRRCVWPPPPGRAGLPPLPLSPPHPLPPPPPACAHSYSQQCTRPFVQQGHVGDALCRCQLQISLSAEALSVAQHSGPFVLTSGWQPRPSVVMPVGCHAGNSAPVHNRHEACHSPCTQRDDRRRMRADLGDLVALGAGAALGGGAHLRHHLRDSRQRLRVGPAHLAAVRTAGRQLVVCDWKPWGAAHMSQCCSRLCGICPVRCKQHS